MSEGRGSPGAGGSARAGPYAEQLWWTRTKFGQSGSAGFQVRASTEGLSDQQGDLFQAIYDDLAYSLPSTVPDDALPVEAYPLCLAFVRRRGVRAIMQKAYIGDDGAGRQGNYFVHAVVGVSDELTARHAIRLWRSKSWSVKDTLDPTKVTLDPVKVSAMRAEAERPDSWVLPGVHINAGAAAIYLVLKGLVESGGQLYVLGSPDTVAHLVRAATEAVPIQLLGGLTFTTFEDRIPSSGIAVVGTCWQGRDQPATGPPDGASLPPDCYQPPNRVLNTFQQVNFDPTAGELAAYAFWAANQLASAHDRGSVQSVCSQVEKVGAERKSMLNGLVFLHSLDPDSLTERQLVLALDPSTLPLWWELLIRGEPVRDAVAAAAVRYRPGLDPATIQHRDFRDLLGHHAASAAADLADRDTAAAKVLLHQGLGSLPDSRLEFERALMDRGGPSTPDRRRLVRKFVVHLLDAESRARWLAVESFDEFREFVSDRPPVEIECHAITVLVDSGLAADASDTDRWDIMLGNLPAFEEALLDRPAARSHWLPIRTVQTLLAVLGDRRGTGPLVAEGARDYFVQCDPIPEGDLRWDVVAAGGDLVDRALANAAALGRNIRNDWLAVDSAELLGSICERTGMPGDLRVEAARRFMAGPGAAEMTEDERWNITLRYIDVFEDALEELHEPARSEWLTVSSGALLDKILRSGGSRQHLGASPDLKAKVARAFVKQPAVLLPEPVERWELVARHPAIADALAGHKVDTLNRWLPADDLTELAARLGKFGESTAVRSLALRAFIDSPAALVPGDPWPVLLRDWEASLSAIEKVESRANLKALLTRQTDKAREVDIIAFLWRLKRSGNYVAAHVEHLTMDGRAALVHARASHPSEPLVELPYGLRLAKKYIDEHSPSDAALPQVRLALRALAIERDGASLDASHRDRAMRLLRDWWLAATTDATIAPDVLANSLSEYFTGAYRRDDRLLDAMPALVARAVRTPGVYYPSIVSAVARHADRSATGLLVTLVNGWASAGEWAPIVALVRRGAEIRLDQPVRQAILDRGQEDSRLRAEIDAAAQRARGPDFQEPPESPHSKPAKGKNKRRDEPAPEDVHVTAWQKTFRMLGGKRSWN